MSGPQAATELTLLEIAAVALTRWRMLLGIPLVFAVVAAGASLAMRRSYTASTSFVPEVSGSSQLPASLSGLAGQFGLSIGADASRSPRFYADVLKSRELLERTLRTRFEDPRTPADDSTRLLDLLDLRGRNAADSMYNGVRALSKRVNTRVDMLTNVVRLSVTSHYPHLAAAVANQMVGYVDEFNTETRQSQARERRRFVEQRIVEAEAELRSAEGDLRVFYERNRTWQQSPQLLFEEGRLRRQVDIRQDVYLTLKREFEKARIEEVNDTPVITIIDAAAAPERPSRPRRRVIVVIGVLVGVIVGAVLAAGREYMERARRDNGLGYQSLDAVMKTVRQEFRRVLGGAKG